VRDAQLTQERRRDIIDPDAYWTERFRVLDARLPTFLRPWARQVCDAGKYINVLQEMGITPAPATGPKVRSPLPHLPPPSLR
jgi:hypothetical protein